MVESAEFAAVFAAENAAGIEEGIEAANAAAIAEIEAAAIAEIEAANAAAIAEIEAANAAAIAEYELMPHDLQDLHFDDERTMTILKASKTRCLDPNEWDALICDMELRDCKTIGEIPAETEGLYLLDFNENYQDLNTWEIVGEAILRHTDYGRGLMVESGSVSTTIKMWNDEHQVLKREMVWRQEEERPIMFVHYWMEDEFDWGNDEGDLEEEDNGEEE
ncbi:unnamed protein product [Arabidopsis halleri]